jgi:hypothetical protein
MFDRAFLDRFLAAPLDADVRGWALSLVLEAMGPRERREERDRLIRAAGALIPGAPWTRARRLHAIVSELPCIEGRADRARRRPYRWRASTRSVLRRA